MAGTERAQPAATETPTVRQTGRHFLTVFYTALRTLKLYPIENEQVQRSLDELATAASALLAVEGELEIRIAGEFIFVNALRLRLSLDNYASFSHVIDTFRQCGIGTMQAEEGVQRTQWQVFVSLLLALAATPPRPDKLAALQERMAVGSVTRIQISAPVEGDDGVDDTEQKEMAKRTYERSVGVTKDLVNSARMGRTASLRKVKRVVQGVVDQVLNNEASLIGLTTIRDYDDYTFTHSVNVCIFSVSLGKRLGLKKLQLYDLGLAALLHDIGKGRVPIEVLNKEGKLTDSDWEMIQAHPWLGVLALFSLQGYAEVPYRSMLVAHEHHMKISLAGYPKCRRPRQLSMFSKLVTVADIFDAATSRRAYSTRSIQPDRILQEMMTETEHVGVDLVLVKALINLLGIYPVGTCVILDTYELAIVHAANTDLTQINRPIVRLLSTSTGTALKDGPLVNLATTNTDGGFARSIIKVVDPDRYHVNPGDYFV